MRSANRFTALWLSFALLISMQINGHAGDTEQASAWLKVQDKDLEIVPGSVLDFSGLFGSNQKNAIAPIGIDSKGHLALAGGKGERIRFLCATLVHGGPHGGFPDHHTADELAAQLRMHGYNLARFHFVDEALMQGRKQDFDYDPQELDRFHYLLAALKQQGIYWMIDAATSENGAYATSETDSSVGKRNVKLGMFIQPAAQEHWKTMVTTILGKPNPYTQQSILTDPALAVVTVMNENSLEFVTRGGYPDELQQPFREWVKKKYKDNPAIKAAWKDDSINSIVDVNLPDEHEASPRHSDFIRFFYDLERSTLQWTTEFLRKQNYKGLITNYNNGASIYTRAVAQDLKLVTQHAYYDHPTAFVDVGSQQLETSSIEDIAPHARDLASHRYGGRPFLVDEYDHPFWSPWRREAGILIPAYAALQGWDGIARYGNPVELGYERSKFERHTAIYPFTIGMDPVARAGETLAALLFRRGDVKPAQSSVAIDLTTQSVFGEGSGRWRLMPDDLSAIGLVTGLALRWNGDAPDKSLQWKPDLAFPLVSAPGRMQKVLDKFAEKIGKEAPSAWDGRVEALRKAGILSNQNRTNPALGTYQSDTGEILLESRDRRMSVITPNTEAAVFESGFPVTLSHLKIESASSPALISLSSVDGRGLADSSRMLLIFATDALNSDMRFSDGRKTLQDLGKPPILIRAAQATITLRHNSSKDLRLYSTGLNGRRMDALPVEQVKDGLRFKLDTGKLSHGPTTYFELVSEGSEKTTAATAK
ncbi:MAG: beta-galactosidase [Gammaproteobacteria bacterium]